MEARRLALTAVNPDEKKDLLEVEQGWLSLARSSLARSHEREDESEDHCPNTGSTTCLRKR